MLNPENSTIVPDKSFQVDEAKIYHLYTPDQTGLMIVSLEDNNTGTVISTPLANPQKRSAAHKAWGAARQSRAPGTPPEIYAEMGEKGIDPDQKLDETFSTYGHSSVGDIARMQVEFSGTPIHLANAFFLNSPINSGQEKSTRYQPAFTRSAAIHGLEHYVDTSVLGGNDLKRVSETYQELGAEGIKLVTSYRQILTELYQDFFKTEKQHQGALTARVLDTARAFLPLGVGSGLAFETSARDWSRMIGEMRLSPVPYYQQVADQLKQLLAPAIEVEKSLGFRSEAPSLIRHTESQNPANQNIRNLQTFMSGHKDQMWQSIQEGSKTNLLSHTDQVELVSREYSEGDRMIAQYLKLIYPNYDALELLKWASSQDNDVKAEISKIIYHGHDNYRELPYLARTTGLSVVIQTDLGIIRDFARHRAMGRFVPLPQAFGPECSSQMALDILSQGHGMPAYLEQIDHPDFKTLKADFSKDMERYYAQRTSFVTELKQSYGDDLNYSFMLNLLPLGHRSEIWLHGDPKQFDYMTKQRIRPGGHINYRQAAWDANWLVSGSDYYLNAMRLQTPRPDAASRAEFIDRS